MPTTITAECPKCGVIAEGRSNIKSIFGFRIKNGYTVPQSWCFKCRHNQMRNKNAEMEKEQ